MTQHTLTEDLAMIDPQALPPTSRSFLLRPVGGLLVPRESDPCRLACVNVGTKELRVAILPEGPVIALRRDDGSWRKEEDIDPEIAEALLGAFPDAQVSFHTVPLDDEWDARIFQGALWGLVVGFYYGPDDDPEAPAKWERGADIAGEASLEISALAALGVEGALALVERLNS